MEVDAYLAFYKGKGNFFDGLIRWYTRSKFSHVELVHRYDWYSITPSSNKVEKKSSFPYEWDEWTFVSTRVDEEFLEEFYKNTKNKKYDWFGIFLSQILPLNFHKKNRYFCSEWVAAALKLEKPNSYSPQKLYKKVLGGTN